MSKDVKDNRTHRVEVEFNQQQEAILKQLVKEGKYGDDYPEVIQRAFQEFLRQTRL